MQDYVVRGPNWKIFITISNSFEDEDYEYVEAATQAVEELIKQSETFETTDGGRPRFSAITQISKEEYDTILPLPEEDQTVENIKIANGFVEDGYIRFAFTPMVLANAGRFTQAEFLKEIIENDQ